MSDKIILSWQDVRNDARALAERWAHAADDIDGVYGIPRGGRDVAVLVAQFLDKPVRVAPPSHHKTLIVDDLVDSGRTMAGYSHFRYRDALYRKPHAPTDATTGRKRHSDVTDVVLPETIDGWLVFPWEADSDECNGPTDAVVRLLEYVGEDPNRDGLRDTPARVLRAYDELLGGYTVDIASLLAVTFDVDHDEMIVLDGIDFTSMCEHHMLPFAGVASVGYVPSDDGRVIGLSKLARLVDAHARRLQVQERMTDDIANDLMAALEAKGVGVVVSATHGCMAHRGVRKPNASMRTAALLGVLRDDPAARAEFYALSPAALRG